MKSIIKYYTFFIIFFIIIWELVETKATYGQMIRVITNVSIKKKDNKVLYFLIPKYNKVLYFLYYHLGAGGDRGDVWTDDPRHY